MSENQTGVTTKRTEQKAAVASGASGKKTALSSKFSFEVRPDLRPYELVVVFDPDASEAEQKALFRRNKTIIEEQYGGQVVHVDTWGKRNIGNRVANFKKAIYFHSTFRAEPGAIAELERTMRINDRVLRFLHTRLDDSLSLEQYLENFRKALAESLAREKEREAKFQARRSARQGGGFRRDDDRGGGGPHRRDDRRPDDGDGMGEPDGDLEEEV